MYQIYTLLKRELLEHRTMFCVFYGLLILVTLSYAYVINSPSNLAILLMQVLNFIMMFVGIFLIPMLIVLTDPVTDSNSQWPTRPVSPLLLTGTKCLSVLALVIVPVIGSVLLVILRLGTLDTAVLRPVVEYSVELFGLALLPMVGAALVRNGITAVLSTVLIALGFSIIFLLTIGVPLITDGRIGLLGSHTLMSSVAIFLAVHAIAFGIIVLYFLYRTRRKWIVIGLAALSVIPTFIWIPYAPPKWQKLKAESPLPSGEQYNIELSPVNYGEYMAGPTHTSIYFNTRVTAQNTASTLCPDLYDVTARGTNGYKNQIGSLDITTGSVGATNLDALTEILGAHHISPITEQATELYQTKPINKQWWATLKKKESTRLPETYPIKGIATVGLFDYQTVAKFPLTKDTKQKPARWKPLSYCRLIEFNDTSKGKAFVRLFLSQFVTYTANSERLEYGFPESEYTFALIDRDKGIAWLGEEFSTKGSFGSRLSIGKLSVRFDLKTIPENAELCILRKRIRYLQELPFEMEYPFSAE